MPNICLTRNLSRSQLLQGIEKEDQTTSGTEEHDAARDQGHCVDAIRHKPLLLAHIVPRAHLQPYVELGAILRLSQLFSLVLMILISSVLPFTGMHAREMGNGTACEFNSKVVETLRQNVFSFHSKATNQLFGSGILAADCRTFISVAHILKGEKAIPSGEIGLYNPNNGKRLSFDRRAVNSDNISDDEAASDRLIVVAREDNYQCNSQIEFSKQTASEIQRRKQFELLKFYILKTDLKRERVGPSEDGEWKSQLAKGNVQTCAQKCIIVTDRETGGAVVKSKKDLFIHSCDTESGNSGSPIIMETPDGKISVIAIHSGSNGGADGSKAGFLLNKRVNYAVPANNYFTRKP